MTNRLQIEHFYDTATSTFSYLLFDTQSHEAAILDSVLDFDPKSGRTSTVSADTLLKRVLELQASVRWHLETHVHADHLSAAPYLRSQLGGALAIGAQVVEVQRVFAPLFNLGADFPCDGRQFSHLLSDGDTLSLGAFTIHALHTPGHTPACMSYLIHDAEASHVFVGDTLFMPDYGTARCDFPGGSAEQLYQSIQKLYALGDETHVYMCHDYPDAGQAERFLTTIGAQRAGNVHSHQAVDQAQFVALREARDATLAMPVLLLPSVQVNIRGGQLPEPEDNGLRYLKWPLNAL